MKFRKIKMSKIGKKPEKVENRIFKVSRSRSKIEL